MKSLRLKIVLFLFVAGTAFSCPVLYDRSTLCFNKPDINVTTPNELWLGQEKKLLGIDELLWSKKPDLSCVTMVKRDQDKRTDFDFTQPMKQFLDALAKAGWVRGLEDEDIRAILREIRRGKIVCYVSPLCPPVKELKVLDRNGTLQLLETETRYTGWIGIDNNVRLQFDEAACPHWELLR